METDLFAETSFGRAALKKLAPVPENFRLYSAEWLGKKPEEWNEMRVTGRVFRASRSGCLDIPVAGTIQSVIVTRDEMRAVDQISC
ncbi:hypothetical protein QRD43_20420 [Pelomonas sp. APW6]|uniref:Uncharacterized protein n=1 Tax=Roseateles subflavus TaxID=3053353 RepID=A0ABT7LN67_9BURK|nr:hypothetical protein [Pelomonas sp. APW6]MDL5034278.1 hypothetical protein [Pelomonas sp. APW6]